MPAGVGCKGNGASLCFYTYIRSHVCWSYYDWPFDWSTDKRTYVP